MKKYTYDSKIGNISIISSDEYLNQIILKSQLIHNDEPNSIILETKKQLNEYFDGKRVEFDLPFEITGTDFEKKILAEMIAIPYGETHSYKELAESAGYHGASRATGTVCKYNRLPIIIPCHRVVKSDGSIGEYVGGKALKKYLIELEKFSKIN